VVEGCRPRSRSSGSIRPKGRQRQVIAHAGAGDTHSVLRVRRRVRPTTLRGMWRANRASPTGFGTYLAGVVTMEIRRADVSYDHFNGRCPIVRRPVKPEPTPMVTAPANDTSVAIAAALVIGCRRLGTNTPGPSPISSPCQEDRWDEAAGHHSNVVAGKLHNLRRGQSRKGDGGQPWRV
jgi:hypothetical protein